MCRIRAKITRGSMASERVAYFTSAEGETIEVILSPSQVGKDHIVASELARDSGCVLIELPQETSSGDWRVWVKRDQLLAM